MAAALVVISIHTYLGLHVINRKVLFVDLALAQIAALGSTVALRYGFELHDGVTYYVSLLFAVIGAWVFSITRTKNERVPQEAIIGLSFAIASAGSILYSAMNPHGAEHLRDILAGSILVVTPGEVLNAVILYGIIGVVHWFLRRRFLLISTHPEQARKEGMHVRLWDFLFYVTFALVITISVNIAGVLLVFCFLIAPAVCGALFSNNFRTRLFIGWGTSILAAIGGLLLSAHRDWPPAPSIISIYAAILILSGLISHVRHAENRAKSMLKICGGAAGLTVAYFGLIAFLESDFAHSLGSDEGHAHEADHKQEHSHGKPEHEMDRSHGDLLAGLKDEHDNVRAKAVAELDKLNDPVVMADLVQALSAALDVKDEDEWVALYEAEALVRCGGVKGMTVLIKLAGDAKAKLVRPEALKLAIVFAGRPAAGPEEKMALQELATWWEGVKGKARWDAAAGKFIVPD